MPIPQPLPPQQPVIPAETNVSNETESQSNSNSTSNSENAVVQSGSLQNVQVNNNAGELGYIRYSNNVSIPTTTVYANLSAVNDSWDFNKSHVVASVGIKHSFGGRAKRLAETSVKRDNMARSLSICDKLGVFKGLAKINYDMMPELSECQFIAQRTVVQTNDLASLKADLKKSIQMIDKQQETIAALKLRLTQMQHQPTTIEPTW